MEWFTEKFDAALQGNDLLSAGLMAVGISAAFTILFVMPLLYWSMRRVRKHMADMENWRVERVIVTQAYEYQVHKRTGKRRVTSRLNPTPPIDKDWLAGRTENLK